jgi:hypothetical protein
MLLELQDGMVILASEQGRSLLKGMKRSLILLPQAPPPLVKFILSIATKLFVLTYTKTDQIPLETVEIVKSCGSYLVDVTRLATMALSKQPAVSLSQAEIYHGLLQATAICINHLGIDLIPQKKVVPCELEEKILVTHQSAHPFTDDSDQLIEVHIPKARTLFLAFTSLTNIDITYDFVKVFRDKTKTAYWGNEIYTAPLGLPGRGAPVLEVKKKNLK